MVSITGVSKENTHSARLGTSTGPAHPYSTRLQSRLRSGETGAMNDPKMGDHSSDDWEPGKEEVPSPRLQPSDAEDGLQESDSPSPSESENESEISSTDDDAKMGASGSQSDLAFESVDLESVEFLDDETNEVTSDEEMSESDSAGAFLEKNADDDGAKVIRIDFGQLLEQMLGPNSGGVSLGSIRDKTSFFQSVGIDLTGSNELPGGEEQVQKAEHMWASFCKSHNDKFDLIRNLDSFEISELMVKIHIDSKLDSETRQEILGACGKLNDIVKEFKSIDEKFNEAASAGKSSGNNQADILRIDAGSLAKGMATLVEAQSLLQSAGYTLQIEDLQVAMKSGLQVHRNSTTSIITFDDVAGIDESKAELQEIVAYLKDPEAFNLMGARIPRGVLLSGEPGTGKTLLAKAVAGEAGVPFFSVSGSGFVEEFVGVGAKRVRELFQQANAHDACIIFIDEIDAVGGKRTNRGDGGGQEHDQTLNQLLTEMDGFSGRSGVIVMAATNRPDMLDSALKRPGRFDRDIAIPLPTVNGREAILKLHGTKKPMAPGLDYNALARRTNGFSGADLENLLNEAALIAKKNQDIAVGDGKEPKKTIDQRDLEAALDKIVLGTERPSFHMSEKNRLNTAYHESGHAIVSHFLEEHDPVYKVTITPRGHALGVTHYLPEEDDTSISFRKLKGMLCSLMGGRVAEEILLGKEGITTGASNDLDRASTLAHKMITQWGFSEELGPVVFKNESPQHGKVSEHTKEKIDEEIKKLVLEAETLAREVLIRNRDKLDLMAAKLLAKETLDQKEVNEILSDPLSRSASSLAEHSPKDPSDMLM